MVGESKHSKHYIQLFKYVVNTLNIVNYEIFVIISWKVSYQTFYQNLSHDIYEIGLSFCHQIQYLTKS